MLEEALGRGKPLLLTMGLTNDFDKAVVASYGIICQGVCLPRGIILQADGIETNF